jgi:predicted phosphodiesterase
MRARRVAVLADVHGNAVALAALPAEVEPVQPDAIVHCGDDAEALAFAG